MPLKRGGVRKKPKTSKKQDNDEYRYLNPDKSLLSRVEETRDVASYVHLLNEDEKKWMNQFMKEYNNASVGSEENPTGILHTTKEERKLCTDRNNARNRCDYTRAAAANRLNLVENDYEMERLIYGDYDTNEENFIEDEYIEED